MSPVSLGLAELLGPRGEGNGVGSLQGSRMSLGESEGDSLGLVE
eukprot:CAMPEP_0201900356 /NCGR_PEP_ID=MMETSP0902-20130614/52141_1 /ASSEMBLY_ACC=CAM_ASM_000551 /TAXON_ID=420261 /ORGANISM="Thalassiosira antarctica, Strain CCMP982" /LENGTH=43 /DNA_ID= /DNA_START= /DNA_END= /DNA_ORIENTATION=